MTLHHHQALSLEGTELANLEGDLQVGVLLPRHLKLFLQELGGHLEGEIGG